MTSGGKLLGIDPVLAHKALSLLHVHEAGAARVSPAAAVKNQHQRAQEAEEHGPSETHLHRAPSLHRYSPDECAAASHELITEGNQPNNNVLLFLSRYVLTAQAEIQSAQRKTVSITAGEWAGLSRTTLVTYDGFRQFSDFFFSLCTLNYIAY